MVFSEQVIASRGEVLPEMADEVLMVTVRPSSDCSAITFSLREKEAWFPYSLLAIRYSLTSLHTE